MLQELRVIGWLVDDYTGGWRCVFCLAAVIPPIVSPPADSVFGDKLCRHKGDTSDKHKDLSPATDLHDLREHAVVNQVAQFH